MTDDTMTTTDESLETSATPSNASTEVEVEVLTDATPQRWHEQTTGGQTFGDRYFMPFLTPLLSVLGILFVVLNLSRVFLAGTKTITIVVASVVTVTILMAAAALSHASKMRSHTLAVFGVVAMAAVMFGGLIAVGHAKEKKEAGEAACTPVAAPLSVVGTGSNEWQNPVYTAKAGCVEIVMSGPAHTFEFLSATAPKFPLLKGASDAAGRTSAAVFVPGEYQFHCTITGHEAMKAKLVIT